MSFWSYAIGLGLGLAALPASAMSIEILSDESVLDRVTADGDGVVIQQVLRSTDPDDSPVVFRIDEDFEFFYRGQGDANDFGSGSGGLIQRRPDGEDNTLFQFFRQGRLASFTGEPFVRGFSDGRSASALAFSLGQDSVDQRFLEAIPELTDIGFSRGNGFVGENEVGGGDFYFTGVLGPGVYELFLGASAAGQDRDGSAVADFTFVAQPAGGGVAPSAVPSPSSALAGGLGLLLLARGRRRV